MGDDQQRQKRRIAYKLSIAEIAQATQGEGEYQGVIIASGMAVSRVNCIGVVTDSDDRGFVMEDFSARISVGSSGSFSMGRTPVVGDVVLVIGRPQVFGETRVIMPESVSVLGSRVWLEVRKIELGVPIHERLAYAQKAAVSTMVVSMSEDTQSAPKEGVLSRQKNVSIGARVQEMIREMDKGQGADVQELCARMPQEPVDDVVRRMLESGDAFELRPGRVKLLE